MDPVVAAAMKTDGELRGRCAHYIAHSLHHRRFGQLWQRRHRRVIPPHEKCCGHHNCQLVILHESCLHVPWIGLIFFRCTLGEL